MSSSPPSSATATNSNNALDSDSDNDDWIYESTTITTSKSSSTTSAPQKEQAIYEMINVMNTRIKKLNDKVKESQVRCEIDVDGGDGKGRFGGFHNGAGHGSSGVDDDKFIYNNSRGEGRFSELIPDASRLTWRDVTLPMTENGRRIESIFLNELSGKATNNLKESTNDNNNSGSGGGAMKKKAKSSSPDKAHIQSNMDYNKESRIKMERRLNSNSEHYITRAVNSVVYNVPVESLGSLDDIDFSLGDFDGDDDDNNSHKSLDTITKNSLEFYTRQSKETPFIPKTADPFSASEINTWPIPLLGVSMTPKTLLHLSYLKLTLPITITHSIKKNVTNSESCNLFVYMYWYIHCRFFQEKSSVEQEYLLTKISIVYTSLLKKINTISSKNDFFYNTYPYLLSQAIILGFKYLCPGNQSLYTAGFKRILYKTVCAIMCGVDLCCGSVVKERGRMFMEEVYGEVEKERWEQNFLGELPFMKNYNGNNASSSSSGGAINSNHDNNRSGFGGVLETGDLQLNEQEERERERGKERMNTNSSAKLGQGLGNTKKSKRISSNLIPKYTMGSSTLSVSDLSHQITSNIKTSNIPTKSELAEIKRHLLMSDQYNDTVILPPVRKYTGERSTLCFRPSKPVILGINHLPRQTQLPFNASKISPLLQQYLNYTDEGGGRKSQMLRRTVPVKWCKTGGVETHRGMRKAISSVDIIKDYNENVASFKKEGVKDFKRMVKDVKEVGREEKKVFRGGGASVGKFAIDVVNGRGREERSES